VLVGGTVTTGSVDVEVDVVTEATPVGGTYTLVNDQCRSIEIIASSVLPGWPA
jgi:hypothetical protein